MGLITNLYPEKAEPCQRGPRGDMQGDSLLGPVGELAYDTYETRANMIARPRYDWPHRAAKSSDPKWTRKLAGGEPGSTTVV